MYDNNYNTRSRRFSLPEKLTIEGASRVIILENIPETNDEDSIDCSLPAIMVCRSKSDSQDKKCKKAWLKKDAPNGGTSAWLIVFASFLAFFTIDGTCYSFGVFYDSFLKQFHSSKSLTALSGALISGVYQTTGPIASVFIHKFGCRKVTIVGGLFTGFCLYASTFTESIYVHLATYGISAGIGLGLIYLPAVITVSSYFTSRRSLATGISLCGSGLGAFFYAPTCQFLIDNLSLQSSMCLLALVMALSGIICGILQTPLEHRISLIFDEENDDTEKIIEESNEQNEDNKLNDNSKSEEKLDLSARRNSRQARKNNLIVPPISLGRKNGQRTISECVAPNLAVLEPNLKHYDSTNDTSKSVNLYKSKNSLIFKQQDLFYSGSTLHLQPQSILNIAPIKQNKLNFDDNISNIVTVKKEVTNSVYQKIKNFFGSSNESKTDEPVTEEKTRKMTSVQDDEDESGLKIVKEMLDYKIFTESSSFTLLTIGNFISMFGFYIPFIYLSQHVESTVLYGNRLTTKKESALLLSVIGMTNTLGRLGFGVLSDQIKKGSFKNIPYLKNMTIMSLNNYSLFFAGIAIILIPFCKYYYQIVLVCLLFGMCIASAMCLTSIILVDLLGLEKLTNSFAIIALVRGIGSMLGPPISGSLYDLSGSFDWTFYLAGICFLISSGFCFLVKINENPINSVENLKIDK